MEKSLSLQVAILVGFSLILAVGNNLRPNARIEWVRDWPPYARLAGKESPPKGEKKDSTVPEEMADQVTRAQDLAGLVTENVGITEIGLDMTADILKYARDFTFWIDARSPEPYKEGHIAGAHLLHLYEKNTFLPEIEAP